MQFKPKAAFHSEKNNQSLYPRSKVKKALEILHNEPVTASEVGFKVGFSSPAYFSTCFSDYFGYPPGEAKKRTLQNPDENEKRIIDGTFAGKHEPEHAETNSKKHGRTSIAVIVFPLS